MSLLDTWYDAYAHGQIGLSIRQGLAYDLVYKALAAIVLVPPSAWALERLIALSGTLTITNADIAGFVLSLPGIGFLLLAATFALAAFYLESAGLMVVAGGASRGQAPSWTEALSTVIGGAPRLLGLALYQAARVLLRLLPLAALGAAAYFALLGEHDINWYLSERPPELYGLLALGALLGVVAALIMLRELMIGSLAVPVSLYQQTSAKRAFDQGRSLLRGHWLGSIRMLALGMLAGMLAAALILWGADALIGLLLAHIDGTRLLIAATALSLAGMLGLGVLLSFALMALYAVTVMHLYLTLRGLDGVRATEWDAATSPLRLPRGALVAVLLLLVAGSAMITNAQLKDLRIGRDVQLTAHRGSSRDAPENTLAAIHQAISDQADFAEIDVQETADGVVVLIHDSDLMRIANRPERIWEVDYDQIRNLDIGGWFSAEFAGERITTLEEALLAARGNIGLNIEIKLNGHQQHLVERTVELVERAGCGRRCIITSLDQAALARVRELAPDLRIGQIVSAAVGDPARLDIDILSMNQALATPTRIRANRRAGIGTHVWTINDEASARRMIDRGVDNIITDRPRLLRGLLRERAQLSDGELLLLALADRLRS